MPRGVAKENLPSKICASCNRPFTWRKVWEKCWDEVQTCSDRCVPSADTASVSSSKDPQPPLRCKNERKRLRQAENRASRPAEEG